MSQSGTRYRNVFAVIGACTAVCGSAQTTNPGGMSPNTPGAEMGRGAPQFPNATDEAFAKQLTMGNSQEVELGRIALTRARHPDVRSFAQRMVEDHGKANQVATEVARANGIQPSLAPDMDQQAVRQQLQQLSGSPFDIAYIRAQIADHQRTAQLLMWEIDSGQDPRLRDLAKQTLPTVMSHLREAREIQNRLTGAA